MSKRLSSSLFVMILIGVITSVFCFYLDLKNKIDSVPLKYDQLHYEFNAEKDRVIEINKRILQDIMPEYKAFGGDPDNITRSDKLRFILGGSTDDVILEAIEHEPLATIDISEPPSGAQRGIMEKEDVELLWNEFEFVLVIHFYVAIVLFLLYIIALIFSKKKPKTESLI